MSDTTLDQFGGQTPKVAPEPEPEQKIILNQQDSHVYERIKSQPKTIEEIEIKFEDKKDPNKHRLSLPDEVVAHEKKFAFRWIYKTKRGIDEACDVRGWKIVSRSLFPDLPKHLFAVSGGVERGDVILGFMPKDKAIALREEPGKQSSELIKNTFSKHKDDPRYYKPSDSETDKVVMI